MRVLVGRSIRLPRHSSLLDIWLFPIADIVQASAIDGDITELIISNCSIEQWQGANQKKVYLVITIA